MIYKIGIWLQGCHYRTPAPNATQPVSTPGSLAPGLVTEASV